MCRGRLTILLFICCVCLSGVTGIAADTIPAESAAGTVTDSATTGGQADIARILLDHVLDGDRWQIIPGVPALQLPAGLTTHLIMVWMAVVLVGGAFLLAFRKPGVKVHGLANALELVVVFVRDDVVYPIMGEKRGERWLPFFATLFLFLLAVNYLGMIPALRAATGNINVTTALAVMVFIIIVTTGLMRLGPVQFLKNMYPSGIVLPLGLFVWLMEFIGLFIKSFVLSLRLFANMVAGHLVVPALLAMIFILSPWFCSISLPLAVFVYLLEFLIALIQALVFTLLSCIFISMASEAHGA